MLNFITGGVCAARASGPGASTWGLKTRRGLGKRTWR